MTQSTQCGFCRETYKIEDQSLAPDDRVELVDWQPDDLVWLVSDA